MAKKEEEDPRLAEAQRRFEEKLKQKGILPEPVASKRKRRFKKAATAEDVSSYEDVVFRFVLSHSTKPPTYQYFLQEYVRFCGARREDAKIPLGWFCGECQDFPYYLGASKPAGVHTITVTDLFKRFTKQPFIEAYEELRQTQPPDDTRPCVLVFDWPGWTRFAAVHTAYRNEDINATMILRPNARRAAEPYVVESLETCLRANPWEQFVD